MHVALLNTKDTLRARYLLECFAAGVQRHGDTYFWVDKLANCAERLRAADVGVQVCFPNRHHKQVEQSIFRRRVNEVLHAAGKRVLTIDTGFIKNQSEYELKVGAPNRRHEVLFDVGKRETYERVLLDIYYEIGYDGLKRNADYGNAGSPADRFLALNTPLKPWRTGGKHILIIGQTFHGQSSQHVDIFKWYGDVARQLRQHTDRELVFRQHPRVIKIRGEKSRAEKDRNAIKQHLPAGLRHWSWSRGWLIEEDLQNAWAAVTFTSNAGVTAVLEGIPTFAGDRVSMVWPVANHDFKTINSPQMPERSQWAWDLAYAQWNAGEMRSGACWRHLRSLAQLPPTRRWDER